VNLELPSVRAFIGVGANLGDARATVQAALQALAGMAHTRLVAQSSLYRSAPVQAAGDDFVNAVAELRTNLAALELLHALQGIETMHGRERSHRNAPRTLDLDLLLYGELRLRSAELVLPHPRAHLRAFVLLPLAELDRSLRIPGLGEVGTWLAQAADQRIEKLSPR
jgi:2-amino-4-hydroxy-6-hydroxymethyldihydropteridine diphosphokinase